jgi:5-methylcytosine-specific restriction endonuclease McrA
MILVNLLIDPLREEKRERRRAQDRKRYARHAKAIIAKTSAYQRAHREQQRSYSRTYYCKHHQKELARASKYRRENLRTPVQLARVRETSRAWRATHLGYERNRYWNDPAFRTYRLSKDRKRGARKAEGHIVHEQWMAVLAAYGGLCAYCASPAAEMDHVIPLSRGGRHDISNIAPACTSCNRSKAARLLVEWKGKSCA